MCLGREKFILVFPRAPLPWQGEQDHSAWSRRAMGGVDPLCVMQETIGVQLSIPDGFGDVFILSFLSWPF